MTGKCQSEVVSLLRGIPVGQSVKLLVCRQEHYGASTPNVVRENIFVVDQNS